MASGSWARVKLEGGQSVRLEWAFGEDATGTRVEIGGDPGVAWPIQAEGVHPKHLALYWDGQTLWLASLIGSNGVRVDGMAVDDWWALGRGSKVEFGGAQLHVDLSKDHTATHRAAPGAAPQRKAELDAQQTQILKSEPLESARTAFSHRPFPVTGHELHTPDSAPTGFHRRPEPVYSAPALPQVPPAPALPSRSPSTVQPNVVQPNVVQVPAQAPRRPMGGVSETRIVTAPSERSAPAPVAAPRPKINVRRQAAPAAPAAASPSVIVEKAAPAPAPQQPAGTESAVASDDASLAESDKNPFGYVPTATELVEERKRKKAARRARGEGGLGALFAKLKPSKPVPADPNQPASATTLPGRTWLLIVLLALAVSAVLIMSSGEEPDAEAAVDEPPEAPTNPEGVTEPGLEPVTPEPTAVDAGESSPTPPPFVPEAPPETEEMAEQHSAQLRRAVEAMVANRTGEAFFAYRELARAHPTRDEYVTITRILARQINASCVDGVDQNRRPCELVTP